MCESNDTQAWDEMINYKRKTDDKESFWEYFLKNFAIIVFILIFFAMYLLLFFINEIGDILK